MSQIDRKKLIEELKAERAKQKAREKQELPVCEDCGHETGQKAVIELTASKIYNGEILDSVKVCFDCAEEHLFKGELGIQFRGKQAKEIKL